MVRENGKRIDPYIWVAISVVASDSSTATGWNGVWVIQDPYLNRVAETTLSLFRQNDTLLGFFYNAYGELILLNGWLENDGEIAKGEIGQPWQRVTKAFTWKLSQDQTQFQGTLLTDKKAWCGRRNDKPYPDPCLFSEE
jgi:hypothetical protein